MGIIHIYPTHIQIEIGNPYPIQIQRVWIWVRVSGTQWQLEPVVTLFHCRLSDRATCLDARSSPPCAASAMPSYSRSSLGSGVGELCNGRWGINHWRYGFALFCFSNQLLGAGDTVIRLKKWISRGGHITHPTNNIFSSEKQGQVCAVPAPTPPLQNILPAPKTIYVVVWHTRYRKVNAT